MASMSRSVRCCGAKSTCSGEELLCQTRSNRSGAGGLRWLAPLGSPLRRVGHRVRLIPPQYAKPFVKRAKNDRNDAEAISEAASRPTMRSVVVKRADQQADGMVLKYCEILVSQRTPGDQCSAWPCGGIRRGGKGIVKVAALLSVLAADNAIPSTARAMFRKTGAHIEALDQRVEAMDDELATLHKANPVSQLLVAIPGVGPLGAITMALTVEPGNFASGQHFAAWLGVTPKEHSTGGKQRMGKISKAGNERVRQLLFVGAMCPIR
jgi:transposase